MVKTLQELQTPIFSRMASALIEATPETWETAILELAAPPHGLGKGVAHAIHNPDHPRDLVTPTDELFAATRELELLCKAHKALWKRCVFKVWQEGENWRFAADFDY